MSESIDLSIDALLSGYREARFSPRDVIARICVEARRYDEHNIWIHQLSVAELEPYLKGLDQGSPDPQAENYMPLYGVPFAIKDNIDLANVPTTAACPQFAYTPDDHAPVVAQLVAAGAIPLGKTNLDQFATGLVGTRSPWGAVGNSFNRDYISGGSSAGSAVAVALGLASFALGTDTAGSGRVPAAFNNLIGLKPSKGLLSTRGVVPACRSLDVVSIFAFSAADAARVFAVCNKFDSEDAYARRQPSSVPAFNPKAFRFGVPKTGQREFFGNAEAVGLFDRAIAGMEALGGQPVQVDYRVFQQTAQLLYEGPWVSERYAAIENIIDSPEALLPVTRDIIAGGAKPSAVDAFKAGYQLQALRRQADAIWRSIEVLLLPTAGTCYTIDEVENDPVQLNTNLGYYTNFVNLLDLSAVAVPAGFQKNGLPFGVTLMAPAFVDHSLLALAGALQPRLSTTGGATDFPLGSVLDPEGVEHSGAGSTFIPEGWTRVAVCGAHLSGLPLNHQLTERGGWLLETTQTAPEYKLYALPGGPPDKPGLVRVGGGGSAIDVEIWTLPLCEYGSFVAGIPSPLGIGTLHLDDGKTVQGFVCEHQALAKAEDISQFGGWRAYLTTLGSGDRS